MYERRQKRWRRELVVEGARRHSTRLAILALLAKDGAPKLTAAQIRDELPGRQADANVHYHLGVLEDAALVSAARAESTEALYSLS